MRLILLAMLAASGASPDDAIEVEPVQVPATWAAAPAAVFVISGGVTMGAYEGGQAYVFVEFLKRIGRARAACALPEPTEPPEVCRYAAAFPQDVVFVGSSAGSINAMLATTVLLTESELVDVPESSTFFRAWVPTGVRRDAASIDLFPPDGEEQEISLYSRAGVQAQLAQLGQRDVLPRAERAWPGEVSLGITTTRMVAQHGELGERATNLSFGFRAPDDATTIGDAPFRSLVLTPPQGDTDPRSDVYGNAPSATGPVNDPLGWILAEAGAVPGLAYDPPSRRAGYEPGVLDLIRASSGLPGAFEVEAYQACWVRQHALFSFGRGTDRMVELDTACAHQPPIPMLDGGVFDNNPIQLGQALALAVGDRLLDHEAPPAGRGWSKPTFYFIDPHRISGVEAADDSAYELDRLGRFLGGVVPTARMQELTGWVEQNPDADVRVVLPQLPVNDTFSRYFGAFLGLFDRSFRVWDFYVGMRDATDFLRSAEGRVSLYEVADGTNVRRLRANVPLPEGLLPQVPEGSPADTVRALLASSSAPISRCSDEDQDPYCVALRGLTVGSQEIWLGSYDSQLSTLPADFVREVMFCEPRLLRRGESPNGWTGDRRAPRHYDPACAAYDPYALAGNLRHLAWIAMERRNTQDDADSLAWVVEHLSDKRGGGSAGHTRPRDVSIFTAWDLGEPYKGTDKWLDHRAARRGAGATDPAANAAGVANYNLDNAEAGYRWVGAPDPPAVRWYRVPQFGMRSRNRLDWQLAALTGRGKGNQGLLDHSADPAGLGPRVLTRYARKIATGRGTVAQLEYLAADRVGSSNAVGVGATLYSTRGSQLLRSFYLGGDALVQPRAEDQPLAMVNGRFGLALTHGRRDTQMFGSDHAVFGPEVGFFVRPISTSDADVGCFGGGDGGLPYIGCGLDYRINLMGLLSVGGQISWVPLDLFTVSGLMDHNRFLFSLTVPLSGETFFGRDQPRWQTP